MCCLFFIDFRIMITIWLTSNYADVGVSPILVWSPIHNYAFKCLINYAKIVTFKTDLLVSLFIYTLKIYIVITRHHAFRSKHLISGFKINISLMFFLSWFRIQFQRHIFFFIYYNTACWYKNKLYNSDYKRFILIWYAIFIVTQLHPGL